MNINIPDTTERESTVVGDLIIFIKIEYDSDSDNPLENWDAMGKISSFSSRHINSVRSHKEAEELLANPNAVALSYFEHGNCLWGVAGTMTGMPDFRWDGVDLAGVWLPDAELLKYLPEIPVEEHPAKLLEWAKQACEVYTQWCNGEIYWYQMEVFEVLRDEDGDVEDYQEYEDPLEENSCGGLYGHDTVEEEINGVVAWVLQSAEKKLEHQRFMADTICTD